MLAVVPLAVLVDVPTVLLVVPLLLAPAALLAVLFAELSAAPAVLFAVFTVVLAAPLVAVVELAGVADVEALVVEPLEVEVLAEAAVESEEVGDEMPC